MSTIIIGGGMSGLSAAYYLLQRFGLPSTLYEATTRLGGWVQTEQLLDETTKTAYRFETGPRTIRPKGIAGANTLHMLQELELPVLGIPSKHPAARNRMIYAQGQLCLLPNSLASLFKTLPPFSKPLIKYVLKDLTAKSIKSQDNDESIYDFVSRRFGDEIATYAISSMMCGICAGNAKEISVRFLMNDMYDKEQRYGGVLKGLLFSKFLQKGQLSHKEQMQGLFGNEIPKLYDVAVKEHWSMYSFIDGMETFPKTLADHLQHHKVSLNCNSECENISLEKEKDATISFNALPETKAKHVICTLPSYKLAECVADTHPSLAEQLLTIPYVDVATVHLQYNAQNLLKQPGFGFLVPPVEKLPILGVIYDSCCFDMAGNTILTVMMGGHWFEEHFGKNPSKQQLLEIALAHVKKILNIQQEPEQTRVHILHKCIPQYTIGHKKRVENIRDYIKTHKLPISLCGAAYDGVGLNDVILSARKQVEGLSLEKVQ